MHPDLLGSRVPTSARWLELPEHTGGGHCASAQQPDYVRLRLFAQRCLDDNPAPRVRLDIRRTDDGRKRSKTGVEARPADFPDLRPGNAVCPTGVADDELGVVRLHRNTQRWLWN